MPGPPRRNVRPTTVARNVASLAIPATVAAGRTVAFDLPWPPSVNGYWQRARNGGLFVSESGQNFRSVVAVVVLKARQVFGRQPLAGPLRLHVDAYPATLKRARDLDNILKALQDALQASGVFANDEQIADVRVVRRESVPRGKVTVTITELEGREC